MKPETLAVHAGRAIDPTTGGVAPPLHLSTIFARDDQGYGIAGFEYARDNNPGRAALESCLAALERGADCIAFASGMAAITAIVEAMPPDLPRRLLLADDMYWGLRGMIEATGLHRTHELACVDMTDLPALAAACRSAPPGLLWLETPSNPLLKITDLAAAAAIGHAAGAVVVADNTFATPLLQQPIAAGADLVVQSATKYIGGSSDLMLGAVIAAAPGPYGTAIRHAQQHKGAVPSPFDCWLALRSIATLAPRLRTHCDSAGAIAAALARHPALAAVNYPGLPSHPGHAIARAQMSGFGGMLSIVLHGGNDAARATAARLRLFTRATSFGDAHSLVEYRRPDPRRALLPGLLRLSIGLEHPDDLLADLHQALAQTS